MPAFRSRAGLLAAGFAASTFPAAHAARAFPEGGFGAARPKLAGKDGGFSSVSCHAVGATEASEVFESEGINLAYSADQLLPSYYRRWIRNPLSIDPQTKMPVYFEDGKSPLTEVLDGDRKGNRGDLGILASGREDACSDGDALKISNLKFQI